MATFVQLSDADPAAEFAKLVASLKFPEGAEREAEEARLSELADSLEYLALLDAGLFASLPQVMSQHPNSIDTVFNLAFALLDQLGTEQAEELVPRFVQALTADSRHPLLRLKLLNTFFNVLDPQLGAPVMRAVLAYALENNQARVLKGQFGKLDAWLAAWQGVTRQQRADLYFLAFSAARINGEQRAQQDLLLKYFRTLEGADAEELARARPHAAQAAVAAAKRDAVGESDQLLGLAAVAQLKGDKEFGRAHELLRIVAQEPFSAYAEFRAQNAAFLQESGVDDEQMTSKMRTLTLCTLGAAETELTFDRLRADLAVAGDDEVEEAVIAAVVSGHVDAKIDQARRVVHVQRTAMRTFRKEQWDELKDKLDMWKDRVAGVLETLAELNGGDKM